MHAAKSSTTWVYGDAPPRKRKLKPLVSSLARLSLYLLHNEGGVVVGVAARAGHDVQASTRHSNGHWQHVLDAHRVHEDGHRLRHRRRLEQLALDYNDAVRAAVALLKDLLLTEPDLYREPIKLVPQQARAPRPPVGALQLSLLGRLVG